MPNPRTFGCSPATFIQELGLLLHTTDTTGHRAGSRLPLERAAPGDPTPPPQLCRGRWQAGAGAAHGVKIPAGGRNV